MIMIKAMPVSLERDLPKDSPETDGPETLRGSHVTRHHKMNPRRQ